MSKGKPRPSPACSNSKRFKGYRDPACFGGRGCYACWKKRLAFLDEGVT